MLFSLFLGTEENEAKWHLASGSKFRNKYVEYCYSLHTCRFLPRLLRCHVGTVTNAYEPQAGHDFSQLCLNAISS